MGVLGFMLRKHTQEEVEQQRREWLDEFLAIYQQFNALVDKLGTLHASVQSITWEEVIEVGQGFSPLLRSLNGMPKPPQRDLRKIRKHFQLALHFWIKVNETAQRIVEEKNSGRASLLKSRATEASTYTGYAARQHKALLERLSSVGGIDRNTLTRKKP